MRLAFGRNGESAIGSGENGGGRELGNGDVIRMPVRTVGSKREDDIRTNSSYFPRDVCDRVRGIRCVETLVLVVEESHLGHA